MKLPGNTGNKITKDENRKNAPHIVNTEVILVTF